MAKLLIVAHAGLAKEFAQVAASILNSSPASVEYIGADWSEKRSDIADKLSQYFLKNKENVLILTDLYGSTHANLCLPFLQAGSIEMISGFNLALLVKAVTLIESYSVSELVKQLVSYGQGHLYAVLSHGVT